VDSILLGKSLVRYRHLHDLITGAATITTMLLDICPPSLCLHERGRPQSATNAGDVHGRPSMGFPERLHCSIPLSGSSVRAWATGSGIEFASRLDSELGLDAGCNMLGTEGTHCMP